MSKLRFRLYIFGWFTIIYLGACSNSTYLSAQSTSGRVKYTWTRLYVNLTEDVRDYTFDIWYLDSNVIIQYRRIEFDMGNDPKLKNPAILKTQKFIYFDLKTLRCQDYKSFDTSSTPVSNYQLKQNETLLWNFYSYDSLPIYKISPVPISDTIIDKKVFRRIVYKQIIEPHIFERVCYLTSNYTENLFHLSRNVDSVFRPLKFIRYEDYLNGKLEATCYYDHFPKHLSDFEIAVFAKWKKNAFTIKLPLQTQNEVFQSEVK